MLCQSQDHSKQPSTLCDRVPDLPNVPVLHIRGNFMHVVLYGDLKVHDDYDSVCMFTMLDQQELLHECSPQDPSSPLLFAGHVPFLLSLWGHV